MTIAIAIAAPGSGTGKTSVSIGLARAFARRGQQVQPFKVGPDFLDPTYLTRAAGQHCYNLDLWMSGAAHIHRLFSTHASAADVTVVEGVMGLFDGASAETSEGSTAALAMELDLPVLLVVNVHGMARTLAAVVKGCCELEPGLRIAGVIANHCGSERHVAWLRDALASADLPPLLGAIPRDGLPALPSRHLGLTTAARETIPDPLFEALADAMEQHLDLDALLAAVGETPVAPAAAAAPGNTKTRRVAIARDAAFHFYYQDNLEAMEALGIDWVPFSPLRDKALPEGVAALYLGGGYPEELASELSANTGMTESIRAFARTGAPVYAECGGLMYLSKHLTKGDSTYPMVGLLPFGTRMRKRFSALGYAEVTLARDCLWGPTGATLRGHVFHYSEIENPGAFDGPWAYSMQRRRREGAEPEGFAVDNVLASYVHLHWAGERAAMHHFANNLK